MKLTKSSVEATPHPQSGQVLIYDTALIGFGLCVGRKTKTYFAEKRVAGRTTRVKVGLHGQLTCEQARQAAQQALGLMAAGRNPNHEKRLAQASSVTLRDAIADYHRLRKLEPQTVYDYKRLAAVALKDWLDLPLRSITKDRVLDLHKRLGHLSGPAYANNAMTFVRAVYNLQLDKAETPDGKSLLPANPVVVLSKAKAWFKIKRRQTVIKPMELGAWFAAVLALSPDTHTDMARTVRDYLVLIALTGLRRKEAASLRWSDIDLKARTITISRTKNGDAHSLPLPTYLFSVLQKRRFITGGKGKYVFPGSGREGHLVEPRDYVEKVSAACDVKFCLHDLRRTFSSVADSLGISRFVIQRLLNHRTGTDVTAGYIVLDDDRLRMAMQQIEDAYLARLSEYETRTSAEVATA